MMMYYLEMNEGGYIWYFTTAKSLTFCVLLQASACTDDDITLVASSLDDQDVGIKVQALNALKAFSGISKFKTRIQVILCCKYYSR